jgi:glycosyltransferase involved in cell wall biosynthesis
MTVPLTVGLPVFNGSETLERAFEQMLAQTWRDFRLVVSDNASTDATETICRKYAALDARIEYHRRETRVSGSQNFRDLVVNATTPFFMWITHDDLWHPEFIAKCMERFANQPQVVCVVPRSNDIEPDGSKRLDLGSAPLRGTPAQRLRQCLEFMDGNHRYFGIYRTEALKKCFPSPDWYFAYDWLIVALSTQQGEHDEVPEVLFEKFLNPRYHYYKDSFQFAVQSYWERIFPGLRFTRELRARIAPQVWRACLRQIVGVNLIFWSQNTQARHPGSRSLLRVLRNIQKKINGH